MIHATRAMLILLLALAAGAGAILPAATHVFAVSAKPVNCSAVTVTLRPGYNPPSRNELRNIAPNIPRGHFTVSLPLYPGATRLAHFVASPFADGPSDPYLETGSAEFETSADLGGVQAWLVRAFRSCGWHQDGSWTTNASAFTSGLFFVSNGNRNLSVELSFGTGASDSTYIGYGVEEIILPPRPGASYLHGPFTAVRVAITRNTRQHGSFVPHVVHFTLLDRADIRRLVTAINAIKGYRTVLPFCAGGGSGNVGPVWLGFRRADGSIVRAYETGPGPCNGLAVDHVRWLEDTGAVWNMITALSRR